MADRSGIFSQANSSSRDFLPVAVYMATVTEKMGLREKKAHPEIYSTL